MREGEPGFGQWVREHAGVLPVILTGLAFLFVLFYLAIVSRFNPTTSRALVESAGLASVIMGTASALLPAFVALALLIALMPYLESIAAKREMPRPSRYLLPVIVPVLFFTPILFFLAALVPILATALLLNAAERRGHTLGNLRRETLLQAGNAFLAGGLIVLIVATGSVVWRAEENVTLADGREIIAYVLGEDAGWYTLLAEKDRRIVRVQVQEVTNRRVCTLDDTDIWTESIAEWLIGGDEPNYPPCEPPQPGPAPSPTV